MDSSDSGSYPIKAQKSRRRRSRQLTVICAVAIAMTYIFYSWLFGSILWVFTGPDSVWIPRSYGGVGQRYETQKLADDFTYQCDGESSSLPFPGVSYCRQLSTDTTSTIVTWYNGDRYIFNNQDPLGSF
ncbi:hypothetical protein ACFXO9_27470 [Nocardia tengchongensis]|uniref:hypothetical protein n=1 Tax=Nocardia tengchongensis TaxID=2055889 RepID=UPI0036B6B634